MDKSVQSEYCAVQPIKRSVAWLAGQGRGRLQQQHSNCIKMLSSRGLERDTESHLGAHVGHRTATGCCWCKVPKKTSKIIFIPRGLFVFYIFFFSSFISVRPLCWCILHPKAVSSSIIFQETTQAGWRRQAVSHHHGYAAINTTKSFMSTLLNGMVSQLCYPRCYGHPGSIIILNILKLNQ